MTDFEFMLQDRITKIRSTNDLYDLENKAYGANENTNNM